MQQGAVRYNCAGGIGAQRMTFRGTGLKIIYREAISETMNEGIISKDRSDEQA